MTESQAIGTGAMRRGLALCPGPFTADFRPGYDARSAWNRAGKLVGISAERSIRGIQLGSASATVKSKFPRGRTVGRDIYWAAPIYAVAKSGHSLQFVLKKGKVRRITLTTGWVSTGGEWTC